MRIRCAVLVACLVAAGLSAAGDPPGDLVERAKRSNKVVIATVTDVDSAFGTNEFGDQLILSRVEMRVEETLKGRPDQAVVVTVEGGTVGDLTMEVSDMPRMERGRRAALFLNESPKGGHVPNGRGAGVLELNADDRVAGTDLTIDDIREAVRASAR